MMDIISLERVIIPAAEFEKMRLDVEGRSTEEACGLLAGKFAGRNAHVLTAIPMTNHLHSPIRYQLDPKEQLEVFEWIDSHGLELVGIYHSHPTGSPYPSETDRSEAYYPEAAYLIWANSDSGWICEAFQFRKDRVHRIDIQDASIEKL